MENILYKKNIPVLRYTENNGYIEVLQVYNKEHLPVHLFLNGKPDGQNLYSLNEKLEQFLDNRLIPSTRHNFKETIEELGLKSNYDLAKKSYFLSLSDQYWVCPVEQKDKLFWEDINFFTNEYDADIGLRLISSTKSLNRNSRTYSPDNTTNGELPKRWFRKDGINYLEKAGSGTEQQEPLNEVLASEICRRLSIPYIPYNLSIRDEKYFCYCPDIVDETKELVPMDSVYQDLHYVDGKYYDYEKLIQRCNELQIPDAEKSILKIIVLDFIMANVDRHSYNISFVRNSDSLQWLGIAPVYDTGKSMFINKLDFEIQMTPSQQIEAKPFFGTQSEQIRKLPVQKIASEINLDNLSDIDKWYTNFLKPLKRLTEDKKISLVEKLNERIEETKKIFEAFSFQNFSSEIKLTSVEAVYNSLKIDPHQTKDQVAVRTGLSRATVTRAYQQLEAQHKIHRIGSNKTGWWEVK